MLSAPGSCQGKDVEGKGEKKRKVTCKGEFEDRSKWERSGDKVSYKIYAGIDTHKFTAFSIFLNMISSALCKNIRTYNIPRGNFLSGKRDD